MKVTSLKIPDVKLIEPEVFADERGFFYESFNQERFNEAVGQEIIFVQDNQSKSKKGVLRGLHYQEAPYVQGKLMHVIAGEIFDVAVDIRKGSATYGQWVGEILSAINKRQLWIPVGFAHGFIALDDQTVVLYKTTKYYQPKAEKTINPLDPNLTIDWPDINPFIINDRDKKAKSLQGQEI